jgi:hypothetical protein
MLWTGHEIYPVIDYVFLWPPSVTLTLQVGDRLLRWHIVSLLLLFLASVYKILRSIKKLGTGHEIYPVIDYVNLWPPSVTFTFEVGDRLLCMTHRLIIVTICDKYLQNPSIYKNVMDRTRNIPCNRLCLSLTSKCDLDLAGRWPVVAMTYRVIIVTICGKCLQNPSICFCLFVYFILRLFPTVF